MYFQFLIFIYAAPWKGSTVSLMLFLSVPSGAEIDLLSQLTQVKPEVRAGT